jgi:predicted nuclease with TOPRIM domain
VTAEEMRLKVQELKNEAQSLLNANNIADAENLSLEIKVLSAQVEIQDKLESAQAQLEDLKVETTTKEETITNLTTELETIKNEKSEMMEKFNSATETVTELKAKVETMQPIVDKYYEDEREKNLNKAQEEYKAKFEKVGGLELLETEDIQKLVVDTINEDKEVSNNAKYALSEKIMEIIDKSDLGSLSVNSIQEPTKKTNVESYYSPYSFNIIFHIYYLE